MQSTDPKTDQLENTLKHDVAKGNHGTSSKTAEKGPLFYADRIKTPYRIRGSLHRTTA